MTNMESSGKSFWVVLGILAVVMVAIALFFVSCPSVFPAGGFTGPEQMRADTPAGIRFSGDSYRYIEGGEKLLKGISLDRTQRGYRGYIAIVAMCLGSGIKLPGLVVLQVLASIGTLFCVMWLARRISGKSAAYLAGAMFALNLDAAVWETFVMTETVYAAAVASIACLLVMANEKRKVWLYCLVFAVVILLAFLRPTGWILPPAALLFWITASGWKIWQRSLAALCVVVLFFTAAFGMSGAKSGIEGQGPVAKLYGGEVVWQEDLWRVDMPEAPEDKTSFTVAIKYIVRHPVACSWLAAKRVGVMFLKVRPGYSTAHNLFLLAIYLPLFILTLAGAILSRKTNETMAVISLILAHGLVVALTFNDNDGRFTVHITPLLAIMAAVALNAVLPKGLFLSKNKD